MRAIGRGLRPYARRQRWQLTLGAALAVIEVLISLAQPWPVALLVGHVLTPGAELPISASAAVLLAALATVLIALTGGLVDYWSTRLLSSAGLRMAAQIRVDVFTHLQRMSLRYHSGQRVGDLTTRITGDVDRMQDLLVQALAVLIPNALLVAGMVTVMFALDVGFALVALVATPLMAVVVFRSTRALTAAARRARKADGQVASAASEGLSAVHLVQAFSLEGRMRGKVQALIGESTSSNLDAVRLQARFSPVVDVASAYSSALVLWFGATRVLDGSLNVSVLLVFIGYIASLYKPLKALAKLSTALSKGVAAADRVMDVLDRDPEVQTLLRQEFSGGIFSADGSLNRGALRAIVFGDSEKKRALEQILHPRIRRQWATEADRSRKAVGLFRALRHWPSQPTEAITQPVASRGTRI